MTDKITYHKGLCPFCDIEHLYKDNGDGTKSYHDNEDKKLPNSKW